MEYVVQSASDVGLGRKITRGCGLEVPLARNELYRLDGDRRGTRCICREGSIWITQSGDESDYLLEAGQAFTITRPGVVLVQGVPAGRLCLVP